MVHTFLSVEPQIRELFMKDGVALKFNFIFTLLNHGDTDDGICWDDNDASYVSESLIRHLKLAPYYRLRTIEVWMLFPEIAPVWENAQEIYRDLWNDANYEVNRCNPKYAQCFPGQQDIETRASKIPGIRKVFFPSTPEQKPSQALMDYKSNALNCISRSSK